MSVILRRFGRTVKYQNCRSYLSFRWGKKKQKERCKKETCRKPFKPLFYEMFGQDADMPPELKKLCDLKKEGIVQQPLPRVDHIPGIKYKTCGSAILLQEDRNLPDPDTPVLNKEIKRLERIEAHPTLKEKIGDPLPPFTSVEQRMIDWSDRKLHPLYLKMKSIPKRRVIYCEKSKPYTVEDTPVFPKQIHIDRNLIEKKNILVDLKRIEPPKEVIQYGLEQKLKHLAQLQQLSMRNSIPVPLKCPKHGKIDEHSSVAINICNEIKEG
ncbi:uncharacterized protein LOC123319796 [Coccinella septempunctata]|uniref:uncharacterized protein LOC123319796 n=1 Tax=Coccinella septempunctata TaxID=41139 RepID=UPI001D06B3BF|nr:uncharacterized protein LOC123319796 [Coccinella septempunctata]